MIYDADTVAEAFIAQRLMASPELVALIGLNTVTGLPQVYLETAPQNGRPGPLDDWGAPPPFITYFSQDTGGASLYSMGLDPATGRTSPFVQGDGLWTVMLTGWATDADTIRRANQLVYNALHGSSGDTLIGRVVSCEQERRLRLPGNTDGGVLWHYRGGIYRLTVAELIGA